ncbi:hypothetical protein ACQP25_44485 (plasmid) [Microtetraspora malaysiensis]|uniref:hypothetical protein n=1 Tax=Microtetraspora malaysiensis TaxID=161358 RepID=UPI003D94D4E7
MKHLQQQDFSRIPVKGFVLPTGATPPADPADFELWGDTIAGKAKWYVPGVGFMAFDDVADNAITNAKVADGALSLSKLATNPLARASHTGTQTAATISDLATVVKAYKLHEFAAPTAPVDAGGQRFTNGAAPTQGNDFVTKAFMDQAIADARAGIAGVKDPVRVAAQTNVNLASPGATIDGITMAAGNRFLAPAQTTGTQNGVYVWNGATAAATRATDADQAGEILDGTLVAVGEGTDAGKQYIQQATPSGAPGAWTQQWTIYSTGGTSYLAGNGLQLTGNSFSVKLADSSLTADGTGLKVGLVSIAQGGTGATTAAAARTALGAKGSFSADLPALTAGTWANVTHGLNNADIAEPSFKDKSTGEFVKLDSKVIDANTVAVRADIPVTASSIRITVTG